MDTTDNPAGAFVVFLLLCLTRCAAAGAVRVRNRRSGTELLPRREGGCRKLANLQGRLFGISRLTFGCVVGAAGAPDWARVGGVSGPRFNELVN